MGVMATNCCPVEWTTTSRSGTCKVSLPCPELVCLVCNRHDHWPPSCTVAQIHPSLATLAGSGNRCDIRSAVRAFLASQKQTRSQNAGCRNVAHAPSRMSLTNRLVQDINIAYPKREMIGEARGLKTNSSLQPCATVCFRAKADMLQWCVQITVST